ncbi:alpha-keto acid decarboxylase family protein [Actinoplanes sp. HUAS TT8]|uniref:alpha-keto acid decarboxylase family protein n=1 Tax=Actinoplanes sp. HUAS TT8 TaxID=3447453 RepID=UPI003F51D475
MMITLAEYLGRRLTQAGVGHLFGVPGDFNLTLLDHLTTVPGLRWVGSPNELGAGYAADAYARARGLSVIVSTYGVGELSCINAIAGSAAEDVPVVHVVGAPATAAVVGRRKVHHTLADGVFDRFEMAYAQVTVHQESVIAERATEQVDAVLLAAMTHRKPAYLSIPQDLATLLVDPAPLDRPLTPAMPTFPVSLSDRFAAASRPVIVVGHLVARFGLGEAVLAAARQANIPFVTTLAAKGVIDESEPLFRGTYAGTMVDTGAFEQVAGADLVIELGVVHSDVLSGFFTHRQPDDQVIQVGAELLPAAVRALGELSARHRFASVAAAPAACVPAAVVDPHEPLTQDGLWATVQDWLPSGTAVLADTGTSFWGAASLRLPDDTVMVGQPIWNSIGYALPAVLGQGLADPGRRPILFIGDGAAQMTVQELSTIAAHGLTPIIVLLNNRGYTIERALQSPDAGYNDVASWDWSYLASALTGDKVEYRAARTAAELRHSLEVAASATDSLVLIEAELGRYDVPPLLRVLAERNEVLKG